MPAIVKRLLLALCFLLVAAVTRAETPTSSLLTGDTIILRTTRILAAVPPGQGASAPAGLAPARTKFKVIRDPGGSDELILAVKDEPCDAETGQVHVTSRVSQFVSSIAVSPGDCVHGVVRVREGYAYAIKREDLERAGYARLGYIYGGLVIPYKYFRHDKSLEPGTTIGPFVGYRMGQTGWGVSLIGTYAVQDIKVRVVEGAELKERTFFALSRAVGFMFDITKSETPFRAGVLWGRDRVGSNNVDVYPHQGKTWVAAQLGWEFGR